MYCRNLSLVVMLFAVFLSAQGLAAPLNKAHVPATTKWVFHVDFDAFSVSHLGQQAMMEISQKYQAKIDALTQLLGSDLSVDLRGLTLLGPDADEANAAVLIYGKHDQEKLKALLALNPAYRENNYGQTRLYHWQDVRRGRNQVGVFATDDLIVISQTPNAVTGVLDVLAGAGDSLTAEANPTLWAMTEWVPGTFVGSAAISLSELTRGNKHTAVLQNSRALSVMAIEEAGLFRLILDIEANSLEAAQQVEQVARGMLAFALLKQQSYPERMPLVQACILDRTGSHILFEFRYPSADLVAAVKALVPLTLK